MFILQLLKEVPIVLAIPSPAIRQQASTIAQHPPMLFTHYVAQPQRSGVLAHRAAGAAARQQELCVSAATLLLAGGQTSLPAFSASYSHLVLTLTPLSLALSREYTLRT